MAFLALFLAANIYMAVISWQAYRRFLAGRGRKFSWGFQNTVNLFLIWSLVGGFFNIGMFHAVTLGGFVLNLSQLMAFLALVKLGTMEYDFICRKDAGSAA